MDSLPFLSIITFVPAFVAIMLMIFSRKTTESGRADLEKNAPVSYTHLTLPTICSV